MEFDQLPAGDVVVLLAGGHSTAAIRDGADQVARGVAAVSPDLRVVVVHRDEAVSGLSLTTESGQPPKLWHCPFTSVERVPVVTPGTADPYRLLFTIAQRAGARAAIMLGSDTRELRPSVVQALVRPILTAEFDLVAPRYKRQKFEGLINNAIVYPLTRALFGRRIQGLLGVDYGFSARLAARLHSSDGAGRAGRASWIIPQAVAEDFAVCEAALGTGLPPAEPAEPSAALAQVLGSLFVDIERHARFWQRVVRSQAVPIFGDISAQDESGPFDVRPLIESFQLAYRNLQDVWGLVLPPVTLIELKRLTLLPADKFRLPDDLWARIVFDFALGHRVRTINRDHLLRALTPAYLAWVASYALQVRDMPPIAANDRLERLCLAFEAEKPYFLRRWRWPDRFNP